MARVKMTDPKRMPFRLWLKSFLCKNPTGSGLRITLGIRLGWLGLLIESRRLKSLLTMIERQEIRP